MRLLVCGGRTYRHDRHLNRTLSELHDRTPVAVLIHGCAAGADRLADAWARKQGVQTIPCPALWDRHGPAAGPIRNRQMLELKPDLVIAFAGGKGTANMVALARAAGVPVTLA